MWIRPMGDMLIDVAGSLLSLGAGHQIVRATSLELTLPVDIRFRGSSDALVCCCDVPAWRWRTDWDPPIGKLRVTLQETRLEIEL